MHITFKECIYIFHLSFRVMDEETMVQHWVSFLVLNLYKRFRFIITLSDSKDSPQDILNSNLT